jgi:hypothetical protein
MWIRHLNIEARKDAASGQIATPQVRSINIGHAGAKA